MNDDATKSMREVCRVKGWTLHSTDRFVVQAIEYLAEKGEVSIHYFAPIDADDEPGWVVHVYGSADKQLLEGNGYTLAEALAGAILGEGV